MRKKILKFLFRRTIEAIEGDAVEAYCDWLERMDEGGERIPEFDMTNIPAPKPDRPEVDDRVHMHNMNGTYTVVGYGEKGTKILITCATWRGEIKSYPYEYFKCKYGEGKNSTEKPKNL